MDPDRWNCIPPTTTDLIPWQPAPNFRSTINILTSCITTLFVCVWSALHVNIPTGRSFWRRYLSKFGWVFVGLFCPELLFLIAFSQFKVAVLLAVEAQILLPVSDAVDPLIPWSYQKLAWVLRVKGEYTRYGKPRESDLERSQRNHGKTPQASRKHRWTLAHGFYAAMGGFVLKDPYVSLAADHPLPAWQVNGVLTRPGVLFLMKHEPSLIPDLAYDDIVDRGKADVLARALLILQVSWFLITCVIRHAQGLPLCLLEITTIAHAMCTLLTYFLWWQKPKDVEHQTTIVGPLAAPLGAWMSMASAAGKYTLAGLLPFSCEAEAEHVEVLESDDDAALSFRRSAVCGEGQRVDTFGKRARAGFIFDKATMPWYIRAPFVLDSQPEKERRTTALRWNLASLAHQQYQLSFPERRVAFVVPYVSLQNQTLAMYRWTDGSLFIITAFLGAVYGLPHLIAFTVEFATATERTLWLVATGLVATMGFGLSILGTFVLPLSLILPELLLKFLITGEVVDVEDLVLARFQWPLYVLMFVMGTLVYILSSGYLVAESMRQLFALPPAVFDLPSWGRYWPHFS